MSFNFAFFNGDVRRDRRQEAMMNDMNARQNFLQRLNESSEQRALEEKRNKASMVIQKRWRKHNIRRSTRQQFRQKFDGKIEQNYAKSPDQVAEMLNMLAVFYESAIDEERLVVGLNEAVRISREASDQCEKILPKSRRLMLTKCCIKFMNTATSQTNFFIVVRFLESFILPFPDLLDSCSKLGYFEAQIKLVDAICEPKPTKIGKETAPPRVQQVMARLFAPFERTRKMCTKLQATQFLKALCLKTPDLIFTNFILPYFTMTLTPRSPHFCAFLDAAQLITFDEPKIKNHTRLTAKLRLRALIVEQVQSFDEKSDETNLVAYFDGLAWVMSKVDLVQGGGSEKEGSDMEMEVEGDKVEEYLKELIEMRLDSKHFRRIAHAYANLEERDIVNIVALQKQFLAIVDTLAASDNFMKLLHDFIMKSVKEHGQFNENSEDVELFKSALVLFCNSIMKRVQSVADSDFQPEGVIPHFMDVLRMLRDVCLKLINLVHPDTPKGMNQMKRVDEMAKQAEAKKKWQQTCDAVVMVLRVVQEKDARVRFLADSFWNDHDRIVVVTDTQLQRIGRNRRTQNDESTFVEQLAESYDNDSDEEEDKVELTSLAARNLCIMRNIPFIVPFMQRVKVLYKLLVHYRHINGIENDHQFRIMNRDLRITVRRDHLYEDAIQALTSEPGKPAPNMRLPISVRMVNWAGMNERGVDGGGIFREFLSEVLKEGFDVSRGLFQCTSDMLLYPNPSSSLVYGAEFIRHYVFLGKMLGRLIVEKQLNELRFAEFFLAQVFGHYTNNRDVDLQHMKSFDPIIFKHLSSLLHMSEKELNELELDFSIVTNDFDNVKTINLKPNGKQTRVTVDNVQEYVRLYVNYHLRLKIAPMVNAVRRGVNEVISVEWLTMFSASEVQILIAGAEEVFDVADMRKHCKCTNSRDEADEMYIDMFWDVVTHLSSDDKKALLKFITGCSRPPIEGFREVRPALGILLVPDEEHLPTSATCMNMLKLPQYSTRQKLEEKLRYAINSGAGFELM